MFGQYALSQHVPAGFANTLEVERREQILNLNSSNLNFSAENITKVDSSLKQLHVELLPLYLISKLNNKRPYGANDYLLIPGVGFQQYASTGVNSRWKFLTLQLQPELSFSHNKAYQGFPDSFNESITLDKFYHWNNGDYPERYGDGAFAKIWWGQSKFTAQYGAFELGGSTANIWWGPGQFNALTFSNNAQGFPHLTLNTTKPAKTPIGNFETQLIIGRLEDSSFPPSQYPELNALYFKPFSGDHKYLNAIMLSYNPKWIPGLFVGMTRTFQQYSEFKEKGFLATFPIFEGVVKDKYGMDRDGDGQDQQLTVFGRYIITKSKSEFYFEFGRRDHAKNWRDFVLNPEHGRAYILGFVQLFDLPATSKMIQVRGEMTQQQESINRTTRYTGLTGRFSWHMHAHARGFTNYGQALGVGIGQGANVQTLEFSLVEEYSKLGVVLERLENNQGFYYRSFYEPSEHKPWVDLSLGFLFDKKWDNLLLSSKLQLIKAHNYQWQLDSKSTPDFPKGENMTSFLAQTSLIYYWNKK